MIQVRDLSKVFGLTTAVDRISFDVAVQPGETVRSALQRLSDRFPQLRYALWDPDTGELIFDQFNQDGSLKDKDLEKAVHGLAAKLVRTVRKFKAPS